MSAKIALADRPCLAFCKVVSRSLSPAVLYVKRPYLEVVRGLLDERGLLVEVHDVKDRPEVVSLHFGPLEDCMTIALFEAIPEDAHAYKAIFDHKDPRSA